MTAFCIDFHADRLTVAGDSLAYLPDRNEVRPLGYIPKVIPVTNLRAVIFARGIHLISVRAAAFLMLSPAVYSVEAAAEVLPEALRRISDEYAEQVGIENWPALGLAEVIFGGWSPAAGRIRLFSFASYQNYEPFADQGAADYGITAFPRLPAHYMPNLRGLTTDESLVAVIKAAGRLFADPASGMAGARVGGEVIATTVTPTSTETRTLYRFEDFATDAAAGAAITARFERGDLPFDMADALTPVSEAVDSATGERVRAANDRSQSRQERRRAEREAQRAARRRA